MERIRKFPKKKTILPYRYIKNEIEPVREGEDEGASMTCSIMYKDDKVKRQNLTQSFEKALGVGDMEVIEQVIKKHEQQSHQMKLEKK